jgi:hypothetical protein
MAVEPAETNQAHRYEITAAMNAVVRACIDIVRDHISLGGIWTPKSTSGHDLHPAALAACARRDVLDRLQLAIRCAETVIHETQTERNSPPHQCPGSVDA